ncbi:hypothetical protein [Sphingomonas sp. PP-CE-3G-477]|uniref:hypothetical protein n=1 Tax=Sphingomonas sp. PP-CE-3G-477 TaxID=2135660 RepID=UPI0011B2964E|nr:hypothetical protein [Sphingomonas sp. PP-CE-3G-477]
MRQFARASVVPVGLDVRTAFKRQGSLLMKIVGFAAAVACMAWPSMTSAGCVWSDIVQPAVRVAAVKPEAPRAYFVSDAALKPGCPDVNARCKLASYVVPGNVVLVAKAQGPFTCAGFQGPRGIGTIGWLPTAALALLPPAAQRPGDWSGHWSAPEQDIVITTRKDGMLSVKGNATWGMGDPGRVKIGGVHTGEMSGKARPLAGVLSFTDNEGVTLPYTKGDEYLCRVRMYRRGPYLLARDNNNCGGMNVTFSGFYARKK